MNKRGAGFWILIIIGSLLTAWYLVGQTMCIFFYNFTVSIGLQDSAEVITPVGVAFGQGFGIGDTLLYIPLFVIGIIGLLKRKSIGVFAMFGALAVTVYWPIVCLGAVYMAKGAPGWNLTAYAEYTVILPLIAIYGLWGMWYVYRKRKLLVKA